MTLASPSALYAALFSAALLSAPAQAQNFLNADPKVPPAEVRVGAPPSGVTVVAAPAPTPAPAPVNVTANDPPGRYAPLREGKKDTGCMITLEANRKAQLAPACRDQGLVVFDPVNWQLERGRLGLTARKGHKAWFDRQSDGTWLRDPKEGKTLILRLI